MACSKEGTARLAVGGRWAGPHSEEGKRGGCWAGGSREHSPGPQMVSRGASTSREGLGGAPGQQQKGGRGEREVGGMQGKEALWGASKELRGGGHGPDGRLSLGEPIRA